MMKREAAVVIACALIWAFILIACSLSLKNTGEFREIQPILAGGAVASLMLTAISVRNKPQA